MRIAPLVWASSPAISRSSVDFPQPEGPSSTENSPFRRETETSSSAAVEPNRRDTFSIWIWAGLVCMAVQEPLLRERQMTALRSFYVSGAVPGRTG